MFLSPCCLISGEMSLFLVGLASTGKASSGLQGVVAMSHAGKNSPSTSEVRSIMMPSLILPLGWICAASWWHTDGGKDQMVTSELLASPDMALDSTSWGETVSCGRIADTSIQWHVCLCSSGVMGGEQRTNLPGRRQRGYVLQIKSL